MERPDNYKFKPLEELLINYQDETFRINKEDAQITKKLIKNEIYARLEDILACLDIPEREIEVGSAYYTLINGL